MKNRATILLLILPVVFTLKAQPDAYFVHYGPEDGLLNTPSPTSFKTGAGSCGSALGMD